MNPHNAFNHFEFSDINNMTLKGGTAAAPRGKRNVRYVAPRDLPNSTFGGTSLHHGTATLDLPNSMFGAADSTIDKLKHHSGINKNEAIVLGASAPFIIAGTAGFYALSGIVSSWSQEYFIGNKRSLPWKTIAKRNGILGGILGIVVVAGFTAHLATADQDGGNGESF